MNPKKSSVATDSRSGFTLSICRFVVSLTALPVGRRWPAIHRKTEKERQLADGKRGRDGGVAKSYDGEISWSSINHTILSAAPLTTWGENRLRGPYVRVLIGDIGNTLNTIKESIAITLIKKKIEFFSYIRKFRVEQLQSNTLYD